MRYCEELCLAVQGCMQIVKLWAIFAIFGRLAKAKVDAGCCQLPVVSVRCSRLGWGSGPLVRGWKPRDARLGGAGGLRRCLAGVMVALFWARLVAGPGAGGGRAGRTVRRGRGWAGAAWVGRVRKRSPLPRR